MLDLNALNSATKYPAIPTFHTLGERGALTEQRVPFTGEVILTEKIDGANGRLIRLPDGDWLIGSREELLTARGDRVPNPALGIAAALRSLADRRRGEDTDRITVLYLEVYGAKIGAAGRQYTGGDTVGARMFDLAWIDPHVLGWGRERIAAWREGGGQSWSTEATLARCADAEGIELAPRLGTLPADRLPATVEDTYRWLVETAPGTLAALDGGAAGRAEGVVLRTGDRSVIAKARFQDYERALQRRGAQPGPSRDGPGGSRRLMPAEPRALRLAGLDAPAAAPAGRPVYRVAIGWWKHGLGLDVAGVGVTQSRDHADAETMARDLIARREGLATDAFDLLWTPAPERRQTGGA